jgi:hypothetical protein
VISITSSSIFLPAIEPRVLFPCPTLSRAEAAFLPQLLCRPYSPYESNPTSHHALKEASSHHFDAAGKHRTNAHARVATLAPITRNPNVAAAVRRGQPMIRVSTVRQQSPGSGAMDSPFAPIRAPRVLDDPGRAKRSR